MFDCETISVSASIENVVGKRKRRPAGTPDPEAEVMWLSAKTLLESERYECEICKEGFQREQNLQMHRRRHKVPWKLLKRESEEVKKRVYVCPEPTCLHHQPSHALGDLVGIKKHFRRKHSNHKQWVCDKCTKAYAVQSDYKAHLKTCGSRGHSCDCGRVFSRVESFIEHQDTCTSRERQAAPPLPAPTLAEHPQREDNNNFELPLLPRMEDENCGAHLKLSIGSGDTETQARTSTSPGEQLRLAMAEKAYAEDCRQQSRKQIEMAEVELANAEKMRQQAQAQLDKAKLLKELAMKKMSSTIMQITCQACKQQFQASAAVPPSDKTSLAMSYMSSATTDGERE